MLPPKCVSCGKLLADFELDYEEFKNNIELDKTKTEEQKNKEISKFLTDNYIIRWCCRSQVLTYCDQIHIII